MVTRLVAGICGLVGVALGVSFVTIGVAVDGAFLGTGATALGVGLAALALWGVLTRREHERRRRRVEGRRLRARVVDARLRPYVRVGAFLTVDLSVRIEGMPGGAVTRRVLVPPSAAVGPGDDIDVMVDPEDPANFEPVVTAERRLR